MQVELAGNADVCTRTRIFSRRMFRINFVFRIKTLPSLFEFARSVCSYFLFFVFFKNKKERKFLSQPTRVAEINSSLGSTEIIKITLCEELIFHRRKMKQAFSEKMSKIRDEEKLEGYRVISRDVLSNRLLMPLLITRKWISAR